MLPVQGDVRHIALEVDEVDRALSDHLVAEGVVAVPRIADLGPFHPHIVAHLGLIVVVFNLLVLSAAFMVWMERKVCAYIQDRSGPNRVGFEGWLQPFADVFKLLFKEQLKPKAADTILFILAPLVSTAVDGGIAA